MLKNILFITAVEAEARALDDIEGAVVIAGGVGRTNAAAATTKAILKRGPFDAVISAGVAGALPHSDLNIGDVLLASSCIYHEEGIITANGFADMTSIGFPLGDFAGNHVPVDETLLEALSDKLPVGPIATVATCSGTDEAAALVHSRTGAMAEAMEGAAIVHAARLLHTPAIELRAISNFTGDRAGQRWDLDAAFTSLANAAAAAVKHLE